MNTAEVIKDRSYYIQGNRFFVRLFYIPQTLLRFAVFLSKMLLGLLQQVSWWLLLPLRKIAFTLSPDAINGWGITVVGVFKRSIRFINNNFISHMQVLPHVFLFTKKISVPFANKYGRVYFIAPIITQWFIRLATLFWWQVVQKFEVKGLENLKDLPKTVIFAPNHLSDWDGPMVRSALPMFSRYTPMFFVSLPKQYYEGKERDIFRRKLWGGRIFKHVGAYPVRKGENTIDDVLGHHIKILQDGGCLCIFPEGKRSSEGDIGDFKTGVAFLAHKCNVPVVPVLLKGTKDERETRSGASVTFGKPLCFENKSYTPSREDLKEFSNKIREAVMHLQ